MRPQLLDLFCGAGGAAMGYHDAGFDVVGVDIKPQPHYPFEFYREDAFAWLNGGSAVEFDAIHASPPCQAYSYMSACRPGLSDDYPMLIDPARDLLTRIGLPYVIENVQGAPLATQPNFDGDTGIMLCGRMFGLQLYRHRLFESNVSLAQPDHPAHLIPASKAGNWRPGTIISVAGNCAPIALARESMGIDWTTRDELAEAIPPAYTEFIGQQLLAHLAERVA